jgi:hypothetical protein
VVFLEENNFLLIINIEKCRSLRFGIFILMKKNINKNSYIKQYTFRKENNEPKILEKAMKWINN